MEVAALVISILAIGISAGAIWYTRRQTLTAEAAHRDQRTPEFESLINFRIVDGDASLYDLSLRLKTEPLAKLRVVATDDHAARFATAQPNVDPTNSASATWGPLETGEEASWRLAFPGRVPSTVWVRVECHGTGKRDRWTTAIAIEVPDLRSQFGRRR